MPVPLHPRLRCRPGPKRGVDCHGCGHPNDRCAAANRYGNPGAGADADPGAHRYADRGADGYARSNSNSGANSNSNAGANPDARRSVGTHWEYGICG